MKNERDLAFYKCVTWGDAETVAAYEKCEALKPEKGKGFVVDCKKKFIPAEHLEEEEKKRKYLCENPNVISKILDCVATDDHKKELTSEDIAAYMEFKECAKSMKDQYCKPAE